METITLTASITYPLAEIERFANNRGYQEQVANPAYEVTLNEDGSTSDNGESPTVPNPQTRVEFVKAWYKTQAVEMFAVDYKKGAEAEARKAAEAAAKQAKDALEAAIVIS